MPPTIGSRPQVVSIGTGQIPWRRLHRALSTYTGALSDWSTYLHSTSMWETSTDFSTTARIVTSLLEPGGLMQWKFYLSSDSPYTGMVRLWGVDQLVGDPLDSGPPQGERIEYIGTPLLEAELRTGLGIVDFNSRVLRSSTEAGILGESYFVDDIAITTDYTRSPGARVWGAGADSGAVLEFDAAGALFILAEFKCVAIDAGGGDSAATGMGAIFRPL